MIFLIAFVLSFIGSVPFSMINMAVANTAIRKGVWPGIWMGLGAAFIEFFQVVVALKFTWLFDGGGWLGNVLQMVAMMVFFAAGIYFFFFARVKAVEKVVQMDRKKRHAFVKGMGLSIINLLVIPYWIFYGTLLSEHGLLEHNNTYVVIFSLGAMLGAFALLVCYAFLGAKILSRSAQVTMWMNKFIGVMLFGFGVFQMLKWFQVV